MNEENRDRIRDSVERLQGSGEDLTCCFYAILFDLAPETRSMFAEDIRPQAAKLMQTLATAIRSLEDPEKLIAPLHMLGARHAELGVEEEHYGIVAVAFLRALSENVRDWSTQDHLAWTEILGFVAETMIEGARRAPAKEAPAA